MASTPANMHTIIITSQALQYKSYKLTVTIGVPALTGRARQCRPKCALKVISSALYKLFVLALYMCWQVSSMMSLPASMDYKIKSANTI